MGGDEELGARAKLGLADFGETVTKVLEEGYIAWDDPEIDEEEPEAL